MSETVTARAPLEPAVGDKWRASVKDLCEELVRELTLLRRGAPSARLKPDPPDPCGLSANHQLGPQGRHGTSR